MAGLVTGRGAALAFGTTGAAFLPKFVSIGGFDLTRPSIDTSYLGTTGVRTKIGGDLYELSSVTSPFFIEPDEMVTGFSVIDTLLFDAGNAAASETITLTLPDTGAATFAGSGHVTGFALQEIAIDQLIMGEITFQWDDWPAITE